MDYSNFDIHTRLDIVPPIKPQGIDVIYMELSKSNYELIKKEDDETKKKFSYELSAIFSL